MVFFLEIVGSIYLIALLVEVVLLKWIFFRISAAARKLTVPIDNGSSTIDGATVAVKVIQSPMPENGNKLASGMLTVDPI